MEANNIVVLGGFAYQTVLPSPILYVIFVITMVAVVILYFELLIKHIKCSKKRAIKLSCEK